MKKLLISLLVVVFAGCAYIMNKDTQDISINSQPTGAKVVVTTIGGVPVFEGTTPTSVKLKRKNKYVVSVSMEGYLDKTIQIDQAINTMIIGNLLCGGVPGMIIDGLTGAMWNLEPEQIVFTLQTASINGQSEKLYAFISWLDEDGRTVSIPIELIKE